MNHITCANLDNNLCLWLGHRYDPGTRSLVIPGHGRIKLDEALVFCTLGVPKGDIPVPYGIDHKLQASIFAWLFPDHDGHQPKVQDLWEMLSNMKTHGPRFKMIYLMYLVCAVLAPTTSYRASNRVYPVMVFPFFSFLHLCPFFLGWDGILWVTSMAFCSVV